MTPDTVAALRDLQATASALGHRVVLIGASAREVTFDRVLSDRTYRATRDADAAVRVTHWGEFELLATALTEAGAFRRLERNGLKFVHRNGTEIDLVPFGGIADTDERATLRWPADPTRTMSLAGFSTLDAHARNTDLGGVVLPVVDLCHLVALKLFPFAERRTQTLKDLEDLAFILEHATDALHDRVFADLDGDELLELPYAAYGPRLLGRDLGERFGAPDRERLASIAREAGEQVPRLPGMWRDSGEARVDALARAFEVLAAATVQTR